MHESTRQQLKRFSQLSVVLSKATSREQAAEMIITLGSSLIGAQAAGVWVAKKNSKLKLLSYIGKKPKEINVFTKPLNESKELLTQIFFATDEIFIGNSSHLRNLSQLYSMLQSMAKSCVIAGFKTHSSYGYFLFFFSSRHTLLSTSKTILLSSIEEFTHLIDKKSSISAQLPDKEDIIKKLIGLQNITSQLSTASTKEEVGEIIIKEAFKMINAQTGEVAIIDEIEHEYKTIAEVGYPQHLVNSWPERYELNDNYLSNIVKDSGKPLFIINPNTIEKKYEIIRKIVQITGVKSLSLLPLKLKNKVIGIMNFYYNTPQLFTQFDKKILFLLAHQCAQALDRIIARERLQQSKLDLKKILLKVGEGVVIRDTKGQILFMNKEAATIYGVNKSNTTNRKISSIKDEEGKQIATTQFQYEKVVQKPMVYEQDVCLLWSDGVNQWIRIKSFPIIYNKSFQNIVDILQDITDLKEKDQIKEEFINIASHELKTPLTSLTLYLQSLQLSLEHKDYQHALYITENANTQVKRISLLVQDMLDITKMRYGSTKLYKKHIILKDLVKRTVEEQQLVSLSHTILFKGKANDKVYVDKEKIRQVLNNLISNAVKYSPHANKINVTLSHATTGVKVCVTDYGIGIDREDMTRIFKPFVRVQNDQKMRMPGMGLGLYITMEIIKAHHGKLWVNSNKQEKFTSFCFLLPTV